MDLFGEEPAREEEEVEETPAPAADEPQGPLPARASSLCIGHEDVEARLLNLYAGGRVPHAMVFAGPAGIGKSVMAYRFARFLLKNKENQPAQNLDVPADDPVFRRVASGGHPDLLGIGREYDESKGRQKLSVAVEEVRRITPFLRRTASEGGWRIVIIDDADTMTRSSQNGLLKILEEPPANALLILVTHRAGALIPTIRSRARTISFRPLSAGNMEKLLKEHGYAFAPDELETLVHISGGSLGKALDFIDEGGLDILGQILKILEDYPSWNWPEIHTLADDLGRHGRDRAFASFAELMPWMLGQLVLAKARGQGTPRHPLQIKALMDLTQNSSLAHLSEICEKLQSHFETVQRSSLDKRQGVMQAFSIMQQAA